VREAITDTGPVLHLHEIGWCRAMSIFDHLLMPNLVAQELRNYGVSPHPFNVPGLYVTVVDISPNEWEPIVSTSIHFADAQVLALSRSKQFRTTVLTDDLALRRRMENEGAIVVGSVGVLIRAYTTGRLKRDDLESAIDALLTTSTLYLSRAFKTYVRHLLAGLP